MSGGPVPAITVDGVAKRFGTTQALAGVSLSAGWGMVLALLGPNGAGKTTLVRILATLLRPDRGRAWVAGHDVMREAAAVRSAIGLTGQYAAVDELLTGRENLELVGLWYHLSRREYRSRAQELLDRFSLTAQADRLVRTYSGGMRRRLDLAASLISRPPVLCLDEPTTGLDPRTRNDVWQLIGGIVAAGTTVLLTTQYMEEAERLAHRVVVLDAGAVIGEGTPQQLEDQVGGATLEARVARPGDVGRAAALLGRLAGAAPQVDADQQRVAVAAKTGTALLVEAGQRLADEQIPLDDLGIRRPTLDDVFLALTGSTATKQGENGPGPWPGERRAA